MSVDNAPCGVALRHVNPAQFTGPIVGPAELPKPDKENAIMKLFGVTLLMAVLAAIKSPFRDGPTPSTLPTPAAQSSATAAILVPAGQTLVLKETTELRSKGPIRIDGAVLGQVRPSDAACKDGVGITLVSDTIIVVTGRVVGGEGARSTDAVPSVENCQMVGGNGGNVVLRAPVVVVNGLVIGGRGGDSGPNANAGNGGAVDVAGWLVTTRTDLAPIVGEADYAARCLDAGYGIFGGDAGGHTHPQSLTLSVGAGAGGNGGGVRCTPDRVFRSEAVYSRLVEYGLASEIGSSDANASSPFAASICPNGTPGTGPTDVFGGAGTPGVNGANGTQSSPSGQAGGTGGTGGGIGASPGTNGGPGTDCCPGTGGNGGAGGPGGKATGGKGGAGGRGGNAYWENNTWAAPGGDGGNGGDGGGAGGGQGGHGGNGGKSEGAGGAKGNGGAGIGGAPGNGGRGGDGIFAPVNGTAGSAGTGTNGSDGVDGSPGAGC